MFTYHMCQAERGHLNCDAKLSPEMYSDQSLNLIHQEWLSNQYRSWNLRSPLEETGQLVPLEWGPQP